jgi:hypothetical protein
MLNGYALEGQPEEASSQLGFVSGHVLEINPGFKGFGKTQVFEGYGL